MLHKLAIVVMSKPREKRHMKITFDRAKFE